jgi:hypothetical protein
MLSASFGALLVFAGAANVLLAWLPTPLHMVRTFAFFGTLFWTLGFAFYVFVEPVSFPILTSVAAVPMHALAWLTALMAEEDAA